MVKDSKEAPVLWYGLLETGSLGPERCCHFLHCSDIGHWSIDLSRYKPKDEDPWIAKRNYQSALDGVLPFGRDATRRAQRLLFLFLAQLKDDTKKHFSCSAHLKGWSRRSTMPKMVRISSKTTSCDLWQLMNVTFFYTWLLSEKSLVNWRMPFSRSIRRFDNAREVIFGTKPKPRKKSERAWTKRN